MGVLYGFQHQRTLYKRAEEHKDAQEYAHKEALIQKAKEEYKQKKNPSGGTPPSPIHFAPSWTWLMMSEIVITNPDDSRFDMEKFLQHVSEQKH